MQDTRFALLVLFALLVVPGSALAQPDPPDWLQPPPFEVQRDIYWDFTDPYPLEPHYYGPDDDELKDSDFVEQGGLDFFDGHIGIDNSQGNEVREGWLLLHIDNWDIPNYEKLIWLQYRQFKGINCSAGVSLWWSGGEELLFVVDYIWHPDESVTWLHRASIKPNPPWEEFKFTFKAPPGDKVWLDDVRIATACVPEPSAAAGLAGLTLGVLGIAARRRR